MTTAVDTNILLDILLPDEEFIEQSRAKLVKSHEDGPVIISEIVYSELASQFPDKNSLNTFLDDVGIGLILSHSDALYLAGKKWANYPRQRPRHYLICPSCGEKVLCKCSTCGKLISRRQHIISDFIIGAHATEHANRLLTRDRSIYKKYFPKLKLL